MKIVAKLACETYDYFPFRRDFEKIFTEENEDNKDFSLVSFVTFCKKKLPCHYNLTGNPITHVT